MLLWKPTMVVFFPGFVYTQDLATVLLNDGCIGSTTQTIFVFCLLEILVACVLLKSHVLPWVFGEARWGTYDELKKQKMVGFFIKIIVRLGCMVQILALVMPWLSLRNGLFADFNVKTAYQKMAKDHVATTCAEAGMDLKAAVALRAWTFTRDDMMAVMAWELAFIPSLPMDAWLHHLFVILGVAIGSDPMVLGSHAALQPFIDGVAFFLVLGAAAAAMVEAAVLMYHFSAPNATRQAQWMICSMVIQAILVIVFFVALPVSLVMRHLGNFGGLAIGFAVLVVFLAAVECKMLVVKAAIVKSARKKAQRQAEEKTSLAIQPEWTTTEATAAGHFNHDVDVESKLMKSEALPDQQRDLVKSGNSPDQQQFVPDYV